MLQTQVTRISSMEQRKKWRLSGTFPQSQKSDGRNGDVNSYLDFYNAIEKSGADTSMIARGAIIKPWIFEEITQRQHLDKSATERLDMLKQFAHWGLEHWVHSDPFASISISSMLICVLGLRCTRRVYYASFLLRIHVLFPPLCSPRNS